MLDLMFLKGALALYGVGLAAATAQGLRVRGAQGLSNAAILIGLGCHAAAVASRGVLARHFPVASFYESLLFISLTTAVFFSLVVTRTNQYPGLKIGGLLLLVTTLVGALRSDRSIEPLMPALRSIWIQIHVPTMMTSYGAFAVAAVTSAIDLITRRRNPLPELEWLSARLIAFGFIFLTVGIGLGAIWANEAWGTYWGWDPKETCALITWLIYAIYLHGKYVTGWKGPRLAWVSILGFSAVLFTYLGVSFLLSGLHSYI